MKLSQSNEMAVPIGTVGNDVVGIGVGDVGFMVGTGVGAVGLKVGEGDMHDMGLLLQSEVLHEKNSL